MMTKEGYTKNCKFHEPRGRGSCARAWLYKSYSENALFYLRTFTLFLGIGQINGVMMGKKYDDPKNECGEGVMVREK